MTQCSCQVCNDPGFIKAYPEPAFFEDQVSPIQVTIADLEAQPLPTTNPPVARDFPSNVQPINLNTRDVELELNRIIANETPAIQKFLFNTWNAQKGAIKFQEIVNAIQTGNISYALLDQWKQDYSRVIENVIKPAWDAASGNARDVMAPQLIEAFGLTDIPEEAFLPGVNALDWLEKRGAGLTANLTEIQRKALRSIIQEYGIKLGLHPTEVGRYLRPTIGLTEIEANAVAKFRQRLIDAEIERYGKISPARRKVLDRKVEGYAAKLLKKRAERIAQTELTWARNMGQIDAALQWKQMGWIPPDARIVKEWVTSGNERVCPWCNSLHEQSVGLRDTFPALVGKNDEPKFTLTPPAHPNCHCSINVLVM